MKIAMISPVFGKTGGPELTTTQLADALVEKGVDVTLFAPADFHTKAKLYPILPKSLWSMENFKDQTEQERRNLIINSQISILLQQQNFDLVQLCLQRYAYPIANHLKVPAVVTLNSKMELGDFQLLKSSGAKTITLTEKYRQEIGADYSIHLGLPLDTITPSYSNGLGLIMIGRIIDQKGIHIGVKIAQLAKKKLTIIGRIGNSKERQDYFTRKIKPFVDGKSVTLIESLPNSEVMTLLAHSEALLFPIIRPETFGRVHTEALASGTPVIGSSIDPLPELLHDKRASFLSNNINELTDAAIHTERFDRTICRKYAEKHFDIQRTAQQYLNVYQKILNKN